MTTVGTQNQLNRDKWLEKSLKQIPSGSRILDAGAGERQYERFCTHLKYVSQDFAKYDGKGNKIGLQMGKWDQTELDIVSDITAIPEPDGSFDAILCVEVFEHLPDPVKAILEFSRLLKKDGILIITASFCSLTHFAPYHYHTGFNRYFYEKHLPEYNFKIVELVENGNYFEYLAQEIRRLPEVSEKYAKSKGQDMWGKYLFSKVLKRLDSYSMSDNGSRELLCFGYHVKALKR